MFLRSIYHSFSKAAAAAALQTNAATTTGDQQSQQVSDFKDKIFSRYIYVDSSHLLRFSICFYSQMRTHWFIQCQTSPGGKLAGVQMQLRKRASTLMSGFWDRSSNIYTKGPNWCLFNVCMVHHVADI